MNKMKFSNNALALLLVAVTLVVSYNYYSNNTAEKELAAGNIKPDKVDNVTKSPARIATQEDVNKNSENANNNLAINKQNNSSADNSKVASDDKNASAANNNEPALPVNTINEYDKAAAKEIIDKGIYTIKIGTLANGGNQADQNLVFPSKALAAQAPDATSLPIDSEVFAGSISSLSQ